MNSNRTIIIILRKIVDLYSDATVVRIYIFCCNGTANRILTIIINNNDEKGACIREQKIHMLF